MQNAESGIIGQTRSPPPAPASLFAQVDELIDALMPLEHMAAA
jgi:hypothetical protein